MSQGAGRRRRRRWRHHVLLAALSGAVLTAGIMLSPARRQFGLSLASGYLAFALIACSLALGPLNVLRRRPNPISTDLRRDIGIWGGSLALIHTVVGLQSHMKGRMWLYFVYPRDQYRWLPVRHDAFGIANHSGLVATVIAAMLLTLSNDLALRRLGSKRWKRLQQANYALFLLVVAHGVFYQVIEKRSLPLVATLGALTLLAAFLQWRAYTRLQGGAEVRGHMRAQLTGGG